MHQEFYVGVKHEPTRKSLRIQKMDAPKLTGNEVYAVVQEYQVITWDLVYTR